MLTKQAYQASLSQKKRLKKMVQKDQYRLGFHIMPPTGWLNDPNGLCQFHGVHHIYFQYSPFTPTWNLKLWGHYTTKDWIHYQEAEPFLYADCPYDEDGVYSGSAFVKDDQIHYFYTGNVKYTDQAYNYISDGREQNTMQVSSIDGFTYHDKKLVLNHQNYPKDMSCHVRDPKIFEYQQVYYMVLGARSLDDEGCVLMYQSYDLKQWDYFMRIQTDEPFGYMWECPDLFEIDQQLYLVVCPQGVSQTGNLYQNIYQVGYFEINIDFEKKTYDLSAFKELDKGFDIYAPQSYQDEQGRRIMLAWMGIPDADYDNEQTVQHGWQHALTIPRELYIKNHILCQRPIMEMKALRKQKKTMTAQNSFYQEVATLYECEISFVTCLAFQMELREGVQLIYDKGVLSLRLGECGYGRDIRQVAIACLYELHILMDTSSVEIFINGGEEVLTSRYYTQHITPIQITGSFEIHLSLYELDHFKIKDLEEAVKSKE